MNKDKEGTWEAQEAKEEPHMALLAKPLNQGFIIHRKMEDRFLEDSKKTAPSLERIQHLRECARKIPFKKDET